MTCAKKMSADLAVDKLTAMHPIRFHSAERRVACIDHRSTRDAAHMRVDFIFGEC